VSVSAALILGFIQGLTEFLPISSSGHLAVAQHFLPGFHQPGLLFDIILHLGTLLAVLIYFRSEVALLLRGLIPNESGAQGRRLIIMLALGTLPAVIAGLTLGPVIERSFTNIAVVGVGLLVTASLLLVSKRFNRNGTRDGRTLNDVSTTDAVLVGVVQSAALVPGISRSGSTIVAGLGRGFSRETAARFSFLLSIPAILGATLYELPKARLLTEDAVSGYVVGFLASFLIGYIAIAIVLRCLEHRKFYAFGYYCLAVGGGILGYVASTLS
jgi:undecaprenyl-diphosphatase